MHLLAVDFNLQRIFAQDVVGLAITGMLVVFIALAAICLFLSALPKVLEWIEPVFSSEEPHRRRSSAHPAPPPLAPASDEEATAVAIGYLLYRQVEEGTREI